MITPCSDFICGISNVRLSFSWLIFKSNLRTKLTFIKPCSLNRITAILQVVGSTSLTLVLAHKVGKVFKVFGSYIRVI